MPSPTIARLAQQIVWRFSMYKSGSFVRFGQHGTRFFKQVLPAGRVDNALHPPKEIHPRLYDLAERQYNSIPKPPAQQLEP